MIARLAAIALVPLLMAHSWYEPECCNKDDCKPVKLMSVKRGVYSWRSWRKPEHILHIHIDDKRVRPSLDGQFHACEAPYADASQKTGPSPVKIHCVYIGAGG